MKKTIRFLSAALILAMLLALLPVSAFAAKENFYIKQVDVADVDAPVAGQKPDMTASVSTANCTVTGVSWDEYDDGWEWQRSLSANDTFKAGYYYVVTVTVETPSHFDSAATCTINGKNANRSTPQAQKILPYITFGPLEQPIPSVALTVVAPADGKTPTFAKISTAEYESKNFIEKISNQSNGCVWTNMATKVNLSVNNPFDASKTYSVTYTLYPKDGYTFTSATTATINGKKAIVNVRNGYLFVMLENLKPTTKTINPVTITNVTAPAVGKTPNYSIKATGTGFAVKGENNDYWTNGVGWVEYEPGQTSGKMMKKNATFKAGYRYAIVVDLAATESGYYFVKNESTATVNGKSATLNPDSTTARVIHTFAALEPLKISTVAITITAPAAGAKPVFGKIDGDGFFSDNGGNSAAAYKNGIAWFKTSSSYIASGTNETFEAGKSYTLRICLTAKDNYAFAGNMTATINGKKATVTVIDDDSANLEIVLSTPAEEHKHTPSGWKSDDLGHWKECTASDCSAIVSEKKMHLNSDADGKCDTCGYQLPIEVPDDEPTVEDPTVEDPTVEDPTVEDPTVEDPTVEEPSEDEEPTTAPTTAEKNEDKEAEQSDDKGGNKVLIIVLAAVAGLAIVACVVLLVVKKKK